LLTEENSHGINVKKFSVKFISVSDNLFSNVARAGVALNKITTMKAYVAAVQAALQ
jgi:hypothetical protein